MEQGFRSLPSVERLLTDGRLATAIQRYSRETVAGVVRASLDASRSRIARGAAAPSIDLLIAEVESTAAALCEPSLRPVINATGVLLHTNLGRAPLSAAAAEAARRAALGYTNLELDLATGERGSRHAHLERLLCRVTGAEAAIAVNNNAAAVMLVLTAFAKGREVIVSRGEAIEIGGGFRIPEILAQSGARLVEVGTTNKTYLSDYERAVTDQTACILKVHPSNFRITGFTHVPALGELVQAARDRGLTLIHDIGSGCLLESRDFGLAHEPTPQESIAAGADLVCFSGDKLLGGPQAGIVAGTAKAVGALKQHPLVRALRVDKQTTAALQATLLHYVKGEATTRIPVWRMLATPVAAIERRARRWARAVGEGARVLDGWSTIGGGSLPGEALPTKVLAIGYPDRSGYSGQMLAETARRLREGHPEGAYPPVMARIQDDALVLDPRTVDPKDDRLVVAALRAALAASGLASPSARPGS